MAKDVPETVPSTAGGEAPHSACPDCGAAAQGKFCVDCGQEIHVHRTLFHLGHELLHGVMHFDGRFWRTLPLLVINPGKLTREWIHGKRTRYVSPLAMFLCTLFVMFMALSYAPPPTNVTFNIPDQITMRESRLADLEKELAYARRVADGSETVASGEASDDQAVVAATADKKASVIKSIPELELKIANLKSRIVELENEARNGRKDGLKPGSWQAQLADLKWQGEENSHSMEASVAKKLKNPDLALYKLQQTTYKFAFLLVPLSIPFMALLFLWSRKFTLYDHGVFVLYSLTFMALLLMFGVVMRGVISGANNLISGLCLSAAAVHIFAQLKGTYGLGIWGAVWRTLVLSVFCTLVISFFIVAIIYLGLGH